MDFRIGISLRFFSDCFLNLKLIKVKKYFTTRRHFVAKVLTKRRFVGLSSIFLCSFVRSSLTVTAFSTEVKKDP